MNGRGPGMSKEKGYVASGRCQRAWGDFGWEGDGDVVGEGSDEVTGSVVKCRCRPATS